MDVIILLAAFMLGGSLGALAMALMCMASKDDA
jgi:hypothetical protein